MTHSLLCGLWKPSDGKKYAKEWCPHLPCGSGHGNMRCSSTDISVAFAVERMVWIRNHKTAHRQWWNPTISKALTERTVIFWLKPRADNVLKVTRLSGLVILREDNKEPCWESPVDHREEKWFSVTAFMITAVTVIFSFQHSFLWWEASPSLIFLKPREGTVLEPLIQSSSLVSRSYCFSNPFQPISISTAMTKAMAFVGSYLIYYSCLIPGDKNNLSKTKIW